MEIIAILLGLGLGFGLAFALIGYILFKLHDNGNSIGRFSDFSKTKLTILSKKDRLPRS